MSRGRSKEGCEDAGVRCRPRVNLDEEKQRESVKERTRQGKGRKESPLADYVPSPPRSFTPAMFFLLLPLFFHDHR